MSNAARTVRTYGAITIDKIFISDFQKKGTKSVQLRQQVETIDYYPAKKAHNEFSAGLFGADEFGFEEQEFKNIEQRVAWENVPESATEEVIRQRIAMLNEQKGRIYKVLSNSPILGPDEMSAIETGIVSNGVLTTGEEILEKIAKRQAVRYPADHQTTPNQLILDINGKVQYRRMGVKNSEVEDSDLRDADPAKGFLTTEMAAELQGAAAAYTHQGV